MPRDACRDRACHPRPAKNKREPAVTTNDFYQTNAVSLEKMFFVEDKPLGSNFALFLSKEKGGKRKQRSRHVLNLGDNSLPHPLWDQEIPDEVSLSHIGFGVVTRDGAQTATEQNTGPPGPESGTWNTSRGPHAQPKPAPLLGLPGGHDRPHPPRARRQNTRRHGL